MVIIPAIARHFNVSGISTWHKFTQHGLSGMRRELDEVMPARAQNKPEKWKYDRWVDVSAAVLKAKRPICNIHKY